MNIRYLVLGIIGAIALSIGAVACSDDGGSSLTLEEFFQEIEALDNRFEERGEELDAAFDDAFANIETEDEALEAGRTFFRQSAEALEAFVNGIEDLDAPDEAEQLYDDVLSAGRAASEAFNEMVAEVDDFTSESDFDALDDGPLNAAFEAFSAVCLEAQAMADENDIDVTFNCEDEDE